MTSRWKRALARKPMESVLADADASGLRRQLGAGIRFAGVLRRAPARAERE